MSTWTRREGEDDEMGEVAFGATEPAPEEYVIYNCKRVQRDVASARCIASIEASTGFWKSTNLTKSESFQRRYDTSPGSHSLLCGGPVREQIWCWRTSSPSRATRQTGACRVSSHANRISSAGVATRGFSG
jgi:hypothetical protein